jgi:hypothetical protein
VALLELLSVEVVIVLIVDADRSGQSIAGAGGRPVVLRAR